MIGIVSDIHGNNEALSAVLTRLDELGVEDVICLGDVGGYYCQINECCDELRARNIYTLMGNHDWYLANGEGCPRSNSANVCLDFQRNIITPENLSWLASLKTQANIYDIAIVHGGWLDPLDEYLKPSVEYFANLSGKFFASGHTHVQMIFDMEGKTYCNPGSVGQPRDGDSRAAFATWDGQQFLLHRVKYDISRIQKAMESAGFDAYYYENLSKGARIGGRISSYE